LSAEDFWVDERLVELVVFAQTVEFDPYSLHDHAASTRHVTFQHLGNLASGRRLQQCHVRKVLRMTMMLQPFM
jgi:hypothetical protein